MKTLKNISTSPDDINFARQALAIAKPWLVEENNFIRQDFLTKADATATLSALSLRMDILLQWLFQQILAKENLSLLAVGGYGREELYPFSDVDLLFLYENEISKPTEKLIALFLSILWDLGLKIGHAVRTIDETFARAKQDHVILSSLLDARFITGNKEISAPFPRDLITNNSAEQKKKFIEAKLKERDLRHTRSGDSRYILEPNIKDGKGGLRDLHTLWWIARYSLGIKNIGDLYDNGWLDEREYHSFLKSQFFLQMVRIHLHYLCDCGEERLTFEMQRTLAEWLGFRGENSNQAVERFMKRYFQVARKVGRLTLLICACLEESKQNLKPIINNFTLRKFIKNDFVIEGGRINFSDPEQVIKAPILAMKLFDLAAEKKLDIHPHALRIISQHLKKIAHDLRQSEQAHELFLKIIADTHNGANTLHRLADCGLLGKFITDFGRVTGQMQFDRYHIYTVDEHILVAISILHGIENGIYEQELPLASSVFSKIQSRRALYFSLFCHDLAKGTGGNHEEKGAILAKNLAIRFGFSLAEQETIYWLVLHQSLFSDISSKRDLQDPATIHYFVEQVRSLENLRLLLVLTVADIRAVGPNVWNGWKGSLMRDLYAKSEYYMQTGNVAAMIKPDILENDLQKELPDIDFKEIKNYVQQGFPEYWQSRSVIEHKIVLKLINQLISNNFNLAANLESDVFLDVSRVTICARDRKGLLADIAAAMSISGVNIVGANIFTLKSGWAVQTWLIQDYNQKAMVETDRMNRLLDILKNMESGKTIESDKIKNNKNQFLIPTRVFFENQQSANCTIVEVSGADRTGFLHNICHVFQKENINIVSAHINTYGEQAVDVFYIKDPYGFKITHPQKISHLRNLLLKAL